VALFLISAFGAKPLDYIVYVVHHKAIGQIDHRSGYATQTKGATTAFAIEMSVLILY
jgi:hypothetical protein